jgi:hypothetical protein
VLLKVESQGSLYKTNLTVIVFKSPVTPIRTFHISLLTCDVSAESVLDIPPASDAICLTEFGLHVGNLKHFGIAMDRVIGEL